MSQFFSLKIIHITQDPFLLQVAIAKQLDNVKSTSLQESAWSVQALPDNQNGNKLFHLAGIFWCEEPDGAVVLPEFIALKSRLSQVASGQRTRIFAQMGSDHVALFLARLTPLIW